MTSRMTVTPSISSEKKSLDDAMDEQIAYIVLSERRPFSYLDFLHFEVEGEKYEMAHGTFRNKISDRRKNGQVELNHRSSLAFYTLKGHKFGKSMTLNHMVVRNDPIYTMIKDLPADKQTIHDIRLKFKVPGIWIQVSNTGLFNKNQRSHDIVIPAWKRENTIVKIFIHKTDTVSVILGCSLHPIPLDSNGIIRFFTLLAMIEVKLQAILENTTSIDDGKHVIVIPNYKEWTVNMWHFGIDSLLEFTGKKFSITVEGAQHVIRRVYSKDFGIHTRVRDEIQEYPKMVVADAVEQKSNYNFDIGSEELYTPLCQNGIVTIFR